MRVSCRGTFVRSGNIYILLGLIVSFVCLVPSQIAAQEDLASLSLEDLTNLQVMSFSKRSASLTSTPASVHVITNEEIRRSGLSSVPELLRLAPGVQVARANAHTWVISIGGFADTFSSKLLVMVDGRSVYSPMHAGVFWNIQDLMVEDIDRIEVIRGPGGVIWGANAVNGVVNIITKDAANTQGVLTTVESAGNLDSYGFRYGGKLGDKASYRIYAKHTSVPDFRINDGYEHSRVGFRYDGEMSDSERLTFQGDIYEGDGNNNPWSSHVSTHVSGGNLMLTYYKDISENEDSVVQIYHDRAVHDDEVLYDRTGMLDIDFTHRKKASNDREFTWSLGYRNIRDFVIPSPNVTPLEENTNLNTFSAFLQEDRKVAENGLRLVAGSKFEHNNYTGFEFQPSLRAILPVGTDSSIWAAVSKAVRTPARIETGAYIQFSPDTLPNGMSLYKRTYPNPDFSSEDLISYELGYRTGKARKWSLDLTTYYNSYKHLRSTEFGTPFLEALPLPLHAILPIDMRNKMYGNVYGADLSADWAVTNRWRLMAGYTWQKICLGLRDGSTDSFSLPLMEGGLPHTQYQLRSRWSVSRNLDFDASYFHVGKLTANQVPAYDRLDLRLAWTPRPHLLVIAGVQDACDPKHTEWDKRISIPRSVYTKLVWEF